MSRGLCYLLCVTCLMGALPALIRAAGPPTAGSADAPGEPVSAARGTPSFEVQGEEPAQGTAGTYFKPLSDPGDDAAPFSDTAGETIELGQESDGVPAQPAAFQPSAGTPPAGAGYAPAAPPAPAAPAAPSAAKPPVQPWKLLFFDNDFSYKKDPKHTHLLGEELKELPLDCVPIVKRLPQPSWISYGGEVRYRLMDERNRLRPGGPAHADYDLWRWRQYLDFHVCDEFRLYVEMIDASMNRNPLPTTGIDVNRWDIQNVFADIKVGERDGKPIYFRVGRQELLYGSQRLISPLDWANTRRNFEGLKLFSKGEAWDVDAWLTRPVNTATPGDGPLATFQNHFDSPNQDHVFAGAWGTYKGVKDHLFDVYYLFDDNKVPVSAGFPGGTRNTLGGRWLGNRPVLDVCGEASRIYHGEFEGGYQVGNDFGKDVQAGFFVGGVGHTWQKAPWQPNLWLYYDWASGSQNLAGSRTNTFNQQYGLTHAYFGLIDNIARQNISDLNWRATVKPTKDLNCQVAMHFFELANKNDVLYTITGAPLGKPNTGTTVGQELDLLGTYVYSPNFNVQAGYFWFWNGSFIQNNAPRGMAEMFYVQTTLSY